MGKRHVVGQKTQRSLQILVAFSNGKKKGDEYREVQRDVQQLPLLWDGRGRGVQKFRLLELVDSHGVNSSTKHQGKSISYHSQHDSHDFCGCEYIQIPINC